MASILTYDPGSSEAQSPLIAGLTEGLNKLSTILDMNTSTIENGILSSVEITEADKNRIYQANMGNRLWLSVPAPVFKKNGSVITPETDGFAIDYVGGSISFQGNNRLQDSDVVTVSCTYIIPSSKVVSDIQSSITALSGLVSKNKGVFNTEEELNSNVPSASNGDFAIVLSVPSVFLWVDNAWVDSSNSDKFDDYYTKTEVDTIASTKEPKITAQGENVSSDDYYYGGRKTWQSLEQKVNTINIQKFNEYYTKTEVDTIASGKEPKITAQGENVSSDDYYYGGRKTWQSLTQKVEDILGDGEYTTATNLEGKLVIPCNCSANMSGTAGGPIILTRFVLTPKAPNDFISNYDNSIVLFKAVDSYVKDVPVLFNNEITLSVKTKFENIDAPTDAWGTGEYVIAQISGSNLIILNPSPRTISTTIIKTNWTRSNDDPFITSVLSNMNSYVTPISQVSIAISNNDLINLKNDGYENLVADNVNGSICIYLYGEKSTPSNDLNITVTLNEVIK